ncbi:MAG: hypothetical protein JWL75_325 [Parcubacteria group bacterium]|nr:hypothetical protein [Parcubacteria group bacterium]
MTNSRIQDIVMLRVRTIHALRSSTTGAGLSVLILISSLYLIGRKVWVARVFQNMPRLEDVPALLRFSFYAFSHTNPVVQILALLVLAASIWFVREMYRVVTIRPMLRLT